MNLAVTKQAPTDHKCLPLFFFDNLWKRLKGIKRIKLSGNHLRSKCEFCLANKNVVGRHPTAASPARTSPRRNDSEMRMRNEGQEDKDGDKCTSVFGCQLCK